QQALRRAMSNFGLRELSFDFDFQGACLVNDEAGTGTTAAHARRESDALGRWNALRMSHFGCRTPGSDGHP
ncbi:MAG: hypothetical protein ACXVCO_14385, partial [Ktedonobacterales bacterium]